MGCHDIVYKLFDLDDDLCISFFSVHHSTKQRLVQIFDPMYALYNVQWRISL